MLLRQKQKKLYKVIDEILWNDCDPIGVNDTEEARDEYQSYISQAPGEHKKEFVLHPGQKSH